MRYNVDGLNSKRFIKMVIEDEEVKQSIPRIGKVTMKAPYENVIPVDFLTFNPANIIGGVVESATEGAPNSTVQTLIDAIAYTKANGSLFSFGGGATPEGHLFLWCSKDTGEAPSPLSLLNSQKMLELYILNKYL
jgi:hypothetical protein